MATFTLLQDYLNSNSELFFTTAIATSEPDVYRVYARQRGAYRGESFRAGDELLIATDMKLVTVNHI